MIQALLISFKVLAVDIPLLLLLGSALGWLLAKKRFPGRELVSLFIMLPVVLPPSVVGLYLLIFFGNTPLLKDAGILFSFPGAAVAALASSLPLMVQSVRAGFSGVPGELEEAARTLGDGEWKVFLNVTLPLSRRSLVVGLTIASARALGDFGVTFMIAGNIPGRTQTLPLFIYSQMESLRFARAHLAAVILIALGFLSLYMVRRMEEGRHNRVA